MTYTVFSGERLGPRAASILVLMFDWKDRSTREIAEGLGALKPDFTKVQQQGCICTINVVMNKFKRQGLVTTRQEVRAFYAGREKETTIWSLTVEGMELAAHTYAAAAPLLSESARQGFEVVRGTVRG